jgi:hypothetical protein
MHILWFLILKLLGFQHSPLSTFSTFNILHFQHSLSPFIKWQQSWDKLLSCCMYVGNNLETNFFIATSLLLHVRWQQSWDKLLYCNFSLAACTFHQNICNDLTSVANTNSTYKIEKASGVFHEFCILLIIFC